MKSFSDYPLTAAAMSDLEGAFKRNESTRKDAHALCVGFMVALITSEVDDPEALWVVRKAIYNLHQRR